MRLLSLLLLLALPQSEMVAPTVEHHKETQTTVNDYVTRSCPAGYEGHFVVIAPGFDAQFPSIGTNLFGSEMFYTVCFKKELMDGVRKNPDLAAMRPTLHPV